MTVQGALFVFCVILWGLVVSGCAVGPNYERPQEATASVPGNFLNTLPISPAPADPEIAWWLEIEAPGFIQAVEQLRLDNLDLRQATERVLQATERRTVQAASDLPTFSLDGSGNRSFVTNDASGERIYSNNFTLGANVSWQLDLFGKIRRSIESAEANLLASNADRAALEHTLIAEFARRWIGVAVNTRLLDLAEENVTNRKELLELTERRYKLGSQSVGLDDIYLAEENLTSTEAETFSFRRQIADETYRLNVLLGNAPGHSSATSAEAFPLFVDPPAPPEFIPLDLLDRRPDLQSAEFRLVAANAEIGVAIADLLPSTTLSAGLSLSSPSSSTLFDADSLIGSIAGSALQRIFEGGALRANIRLQESEARELALSYEQTILDALRELETALQADRKLALQAAKNAKSVESLRAAETISLRRYQDGLLDLRSLLDTQQRRYRAEQTWLRSYQDLWNNRISLYLAAGGPIAGSTQVGEPSNAPL
ncbi:MAG: efflux transporter outer membrane subunit [Verrucomicrobiota bacterium]